MATEEIEAAQPVAVYTEDDLYRREMWEWMGRDAAEWERRYPGAEADLLRLRGEMLYEDANGVIRHRPDWVPSDPTLFARRDK